MVAASEKALNRVADATAFLVGGAAEKEADIPVFAPVMNPGNRLMEEDVQRRLESQSRFVQETASCEDHSWIRLDEPAREAVIAGLSDLRRETVGHG